MTTPVCLENLIKQQVNEDLVNQQAARLKDDLEALLADTTNGSKNYTREKYDLLVEDWAKLDYEIAGLLRTMECKVDCWRCVVECYLCPFLHQAQYAEKWLYDNGDAFRHVYDLYDLQYWHSKYVASKERQYTRINDVMTAWLNPVAVLENVMAKNWELYGEAIKVVGKEPGRVIYDIFFKLVPRHLAIAPPRGSEWQTRIDKRFTEFCECGTSVPDNCCGPNTGELTVRQRLTGYYSDGKHLPYLIDPGEYFKLVCCLVEHRWTPARIARDKAILEKATIDSRISTHLAEMDEKVLWEKLNTAASAIPSQIECCDYDPAHAGASKPTRYSAH